MPASWACRSDVAANTRLDSLSDLAKHEANLLVLCTCGRAQVLSTPRLARYVMLRNWNDQLQALRSRLRGAACGKRPTYLKATPELPTLADPFPRDERGWELLRRKLRD